MGNRSKSLAPLLSMMAGVLVAASAVDADAADPISKPQVMQEPGEVTNIIDAFDDDNGDPYDATISLNFQYLSKRARITRETSVFEPGLTTGGYTARTQNVGEYIETTSRLQPRLDLGIYKDLAFHAAFPIVLANSRRIDDIDGSAGNVAAVAGGAPGETLFALPFVAPDRSGLEYIELGLDLGIFNQARDYTKPTWVFGFLGRITTGNPMNACTTTPAAGQLECADAGDIDRDGNFDEDVVGASGQPLEARSLSSELGPGVDRGTITLQVHSMMSKRLKYIEPYGGFNARFEFQQGDASKFLQTDLEGALVNHPPLRGTVTVGMMVIPWENREKFGRLTFDMRFEGEYVSEGRDYSELFDALGSSSAASLRNPKWSRFRDACPDGSCTPKSVVDEGSQKTYFNGLSVVEPYGNYRVSGAATWQASEYIKLNYGMGITFTQAHGIGHDQPCNPDFKDDVGASGPCHSGDAAVGPISATGIPNPAYRPTINAIGRRFYVDESITYEIFANGVVMF